MSEFMYYLAVTLISTFAGFFTGLLGVGGGIIIFPAFLFILPMFGFKPLDINHITGITTIQIITGSIFSFLARTAESKVDYKSLYKISICAAAGAFTGSLSSAFFSKKALLICYFLILLISFLSLTIIKIPAEENNDPNKDIKVNILCFISGIFAGLLGLGAAVLYIPILRYFYRISTKVTIGSVSFIVLSGAVMTLLGKIMTFQIPYGLILYVLIGSFIGAKIGAFVSKQLSSATLKKILLVIIISTGLRVLASLFFE